MKKSFRKTPKYVVEKLKVISDPLIYTAAIVSYDISSIEKELRKHGLKYSDDKIENPAPFLPKRSHGKYSSINSAGEVIVRKDLPKIEKTFSFEAPNFGDYSKGTHEIEYEREVYRREFVQPQKHKIVPEVIETTTENIVIGFRIDKQLNKKQKRFSDELLFCLNLLQENFGTCDIFGSTSKMTQRDAYKKLSWEVLPQGWWTDKNQVEKIKQKLGKHQSDLFIERLKHIESLNPLESYRGESLLGKRIYYVFVFKKHVLAECPMFGNALYVLNERSKEQWREIFSKSKIVALQNGAVRILHKKGWQDALNRMLSEKS